MSHTESAAGRTTIVIDADACPCGAAETIRRLQLEYGYAVVTVASVNHMVQTWGSWHEHVVVSPEPQAADIALANRTTRGDIVVTQDWGLAALAIGRGAKAVSPTGRIFEPGTIEFLLEERYAKAKHRRGGGRTKGPRPRGREDEMRFERSLRTLLGPVPGGPSPTRA